MRTLSIFIFLLCFSKYFAQSKNEIQFFTKNQKGLEIIAKDSLFSCQFQFRMQNRMAYESRSESDLTPETFEFRVRRLRLKMAGFVYNPKWTYKIQLAFSRGDMDWESTQPSNTNTSVNIVRDALISYQIAPNLQGSFGQTKLPGNRQRFISSGDQQFADRSILNATMTIDRDFGVFLNYSKKYFKIIGAVSSGEGRNSTRSDKGLSYTGRVEILPLGSFTGKNEYIEGDLEREIKPKFSIGASYNYNSQARRNGGQLGNDLFTPTDIQNFHLDLLFKYRGFATYNEFCLRLSPDPVTVNSSNSTISYIFNGYGFLNQLSYLFKNNIEIATRYVFIQPYSSLFYNPNHPTLNVNRQDQIHLGITKYLNGHRLKVQSNVTYNTKTNMQDNKMTGKLGLIFQIELGI